MPSRSSSFTRLASEKRGGGSVKCCDGVISRTSDPVALGQRRDRREVLHLPALLLLPSLGVEHVEAVEDDDRPGGPEQIAAEVEVHDRHVVHRRRHLRRDEALPDELVEPELVGLEVALDLLGAAAHVGRADRLVGVLHPGVLPVAVGVGLRRAGTACRSARR